MKRAKKRDFRKIPVRFNYWFDGKPVKIDLLPGKCINLYVGHRTDEGYRTESVTLSVEGRTIIEQYCFTQRDCDGLHKESGERHAPVSERASRRSVRRLGEKGDRRGFPNFTQTDSAAYDQYAEMAGY